MLLSYSKADFIMSRWGRQQKLSFLSSNFYNLFFSTLFHTHIAVSFFFLCMKRVLEKKDLTFLKEKAF